MAEEVKSVLGKWVLKYQWNEVVVGTRWDTARGVRVMWRNGYMAHTISVDLGIRLVVDTGDVPTVQTVLGSGRGYQKPKMHESVMRVGKGDPMLGIRVARDTEGE